MMGMGQRRRRWHLCGLDLLKCTVLHPGILPTCLNFVLSGNQTKFEKKLSEDGESMGTGPLEDDVIWMLQKTPNSWSLEAKLEKNLHVDTAYTEDGSCVSDAHTYKCMCMSIKPSCTAESVILHTGEAQLKWLIKADFFELVSTTALMKRLHLKFLQRPWSETGKLVRACMDKPKTGSTTASKSPISSCLEKLRRAISAKALFAVTNKLEFLSKQKRLNSHTSPNGTAFYITSEMFYIEIQLKADGEVIEVKLAHPGGSPEICEDLLQVLRMENYDAFGKILEELLNVYHIPGNREIKAKVYLALQSLEKDITSLSLLHRAPDTERITEILCGKVGYVRPRTGGTPMSLEFYLSPSQILEEQLTPGLQVPGMKVLVTIGRSDVTYKLPIHPLIQGPWTEADGHPVFSPLTEKLCMEFSACFFLKFHQPFPMSLSSIQKLQEFTGITVHGLNLAPLHALIVYHTLSERHKDNPTMTNYFVVSLPDCPKHCYYIGNGTGGPGLTGAMVSKLPFTHPKDVLDMIEVLRHQAAYNTLVSSCISGATNTEVSSDLLHFEICPLKASSFSVTFQQPGEENLACVVIDVPSSKEVRCSLHAASKDWALNSTEDFLTRVLKRCMSVPILMRTIFKKAAKLKLDEAVRGMEETSEQNPQEASESAVLEDSRSSLCNAMACETWSPDITESLLELSSQAFLSDTMEEDAASVEPSDDGTEASTPSSSLPVSSWEMEALLLSAGEDTSGGQVEEDATGEPQT